MESYQLGNKLDESQGSNKDIAIKYDAGRVKTEKYGEATLSGYLLLPTRFGEYPPVYAKQIKEKAYIWLNEMGMDECVDELINKIQITIMISLTAPGVNPEKLELYFKAMTFGFFLDDAVTKLRHLNEKDAIKQQEDMIKVVKLLVSMVRSNGNGTSTDAAISNLNPIFKNACIALSHTCRQGFEQMCKDHYEIFSRDLIDFIRVNKWIQEEYNSNYSENECIFWRLKDIAVKLAVEAIYFAKDIRISDEIRTHPLFIKYLDVLCTHTVLVNDIFSLRKELLNDERENIVLIKCQEFSLQKAIYKTEEAANKLIFELKKCGIKLNSYFPSDCNPKDFVKTLEYIADGFTYWYQESKRYGYIKFEKYEVKYDFDENNWLKEKCAGNVENMKEPTLNE